jgi:hypothetical protein
MKEVKLEQLSADAGRMLSPTASERVVLTRAGKPVAIVTPVLNLDEEDLSYIESPDFWKMIADRRKQPRISLADAEARLIARERAESGK